MIKELLRELIKRPSISPEDAGCQTFMMNFFSKLGFNCQILDNPPAANFFARFGTQSPLLVFAGHTDVVQPGDVSSWHSSPFQLTERDGRAFGRGTADMKGSLAAMMAMASRLIHTQAHFNGSLGFLITSAEEGDDFANGTPYVMEKLHEQGIHIDYCVVGEPSATKRVGDVIKIGRRGSLTGHLHLQGKQGHVAYPHLADNPIHRLSPALLDLTAQIWDEGNAWFPPTTFQITHIHSGGGAGNVIPGDLKLDFNFRFSTEQTAEGIQEKFSSCIEKHGLNPSISWRLNGVPFLTSQGRLLDCAVEAIKITTDLKPELSTSGGTSDGRFIAPYGVEVIELGPVNASIHQINEWVSLEDLDKLEKIYYSICCGLLQAS